MSHRKLLFVTFKWFPCLMGCSVRSCAPSYRSRDYLANDTETYRSSDLVPGTIASFSWYLDLFLRLLAGKYPSTCYVILRFELHQINEVKNLVVNPGVPLEVFRSCKLLVVPSYFLD